MNRLCPLNPSAYGYEEAHGLAEAYASGRADPVEVTQACLERASERKDVFIAITEDRAIREAMASRARYRAKAPVSLFDGVPIGWKDVYDVAGTITTAGSILFKDNPPAVKDCALACHVAKAGMVCIGKLNTTEFAYSSIGINQHFGTPCNPFSDEREPRIPGGSSSGSAVAVAAGILPVSIGSDTGGSIRIPSAFNGLTSFKPSVNRYPRSAMTHLARTLDTPGPMCRSIRDLVVMDGILSGCTEQAAALSFSQPGALHFIIERSLLFDEHIDDCVKSMLEQAGNRLSRMGATVSYKNIGALQKAMRHVSAPWFMGKECFTELSSILNDPAKASLMDQRIRKRAEAFRDMTSEQMEQSLKCRAELIPAFEKEMGDAILIMPAVGHGAPPLKTIMEDEATFFYFINANTRLTTPANFLDLPGITIPMGQDDDGMPLGACLYAPSGHDARLLSAALTCEKTLLYQEQDE